MKTNHLLRFLSLIVFTFFASETVGQSLIKRIWENNKKYLLLTGEYQDDQRFYIGMVAPQISYTSFDFKLADDFNLRRIDSKAASETFINSVSSSKGLKVGFGIPMRYRVSDYLSLESGFVYMPNFDEGTTSNKFRNGQTLNFHLSDNTIEKRMQKGDGSNGENYSMIEIPLRAQIYSDQKFLSQTSSNSYKMMLIFGVNQITHFGANQYNLHIQNFDKTNPSLLYKSTYLTGEAGIGFAYFSKYTKISVQARYSQNITENLLNTKLHLQHIANILDYNNAYMDAIQKLGVRGWKISIILE